ncbi:MAG: hypothetical protein Q8S84_09010 [bacterium]|nr:hypothetical protein [bacterium]
MSIGYLPSGINSLPLSGERGYMCTLVLIPPPRTSGTPFGKGRNLYS